MSSTYAGLWRSWSVKAREADAEAASARWLGRPDQGVQHVADWGIARVDPNAPGSTYDVASGYASGDPRAGAGELQSDDHGAANTAVGRQQLGAGHLWADPPPPLLADHDDVPPGIFGGGGPLSGNDYNGDDLNQHNADWGDVGERRSGHWQEEHGVSLSNDSKYIGSDDVNYPATAHQVDRGDIAAQQRRMIPRGQSSDEVDTSEQYEYRPMAHGGSTAQIKYSQVASVEVSGAPGQEVAQKHDPGPEHRRAAGPSLTWVNDHGGPEPDPAISVRNRRWVERRIPGKHFFRHDMRPLFWRLARTPGGPGTLPGSTHQSSPFPAGLPGTSEIAVGLFSKPVIRRTPPAWDETAATDGSTDGAADNSGMWSGFGGL